MDGNALNWIKSSYSGSGGGNCVEIAATPAWIKSSYSGTGGGNCVEVAPTAHTAHIRDSKNADGPVLSVPSHAWSRFLRHAAQHG